MLDSAILMSLEARLPPEQPLMVEERVVHDAAFDRWERIGRRIADSFEEDAERYITGMAAMQRRFAGARAMGTASPEELARFTRAIDDFEWVAELRARKAAKAEKRMLRQIKAEAKAMPAVAAARRKVGARLFATDKRLIDAVLDHALFLRALRSEIDPAAQDAPTFGETADLHGYLAGLGAV